MVNFRTKSALQGRGDIQGSVMTMVMTILLTTTKRMMIMAIMLRTMVITAMAGSQRGILTAINALQCGTGGGCCSLMVVGKSKKITMTIMAAR